MKPEPLNDEAAQEIAEDYEGPPGEPPFAGATGSACLGLVFPVGRKMGIDELPTIVWRMMHEDVTRRTKELNMDDHDLEDDRLHEEKQALKAENKRLRAAIVEYVHAARCNVPAGRSQCAWDALCAIVDEQNAERDPTPRKAAD